MGLRGFGAGDHDLDQSGSDSMECGCRRYAMQDFLFARSLSLSFSLSRLSSFSRSGETTLSSSGQSSPPPGL